MILIKKNHTYSSFLMRNIRFAWPLIVMCLLFVFIYSENPFFWLMTSLGVFIIAIIQGERKSRYFIEEISVNGDDLKVIYYRYNTKVTYSGQLSQGLFKVNDRFTTFKWREPALEIIDGSRHVVQFCVFGWTQDDIEKVRTALQTKVQ